MIWVICLCIKCCQVRIQHIDAVLLSVNLNTTTSSYPTEVLDSSQSVPVDLSLSALIMLPKYSKLADKKVLLIGGTSGIGFATAALVLEHNGIAIISSSQPSKIESALLRLRTTYPELANRVTGFPCDLSDPDTLDSNITALFEFAASFKPSPFLSTLKSQRPVISQDAASTAQSPIHHITFTAGNAAPITPLSQASSTALTDLAQVRYVAAVFVAKHAPKYLAPGPESSLTFTSNVSDIKPAKGWALSTAATSLMGLVRGAALDLAPVRVNLVKVGWVETERLRSMIGYIGDEVGKRDDEAGQRGRKMLEDRARQSLTGKLGSPDSVAEAYMYFIKDWHVTGQSIVTDGGYTLT